MFSLMDKSYKTLADTFSVSPATHLSAKDDTTILRSSRSKMSEARGIQPFPQNPSDLHFIKGTPAGTCLAYSSYCNPKNCLKKYSSYGILCAKKRQTTSVNAIVDMGLQSIICVPTDHMKKPQ